MGNLTPFLADHVPKSDPPEVQLAQAMRNAGQTPPDTIVLDGVLRRYDDQKANGDALWYVAFESGLVPGGAFGSFRAGTHTNWKGDIGRTLSIAEEMAYRSALETVKQKAEAEKRIRNEQAADDSQKIWDSLTPAGAAHPYLARKKIHPHVARADGVGNLVIPMYSPEGDMLSLQTITPDGEKRFHKGGRTKGALLYFGSPGSRIYVGEGFATAATIYEVTGICTVAAFSAANLLPVVESIRQSNPSAEIVIVADNDKLDPHQKIYPGKHWADLAASTYGASVVMPPGEPGAGDANDYWVAGGDLLSVLTPYQETWLIDGDTFTQQPAPIRWMVKKWIQADSLIMVHGPSGSGKTFVVLDWCLTLASGSDDWRGFKVRPASVVYLAGEGHHGVRGRMAAWKAHHGYTGSLKGISVSRSGCDLNTPLGLQMVLTSIRQLPEKPGLVVVDTLHRFLSGDENSAQDAKTMLDACAMIQREFSCSVLLVHHTGVNEEAQHRARGSSAWRGALDIEINIQPAPVPGGTLTIVQKKSKDAELADKVFGELLSVTVPGWLDEDGEPVKSAVLIDADEPKKRTTKAEEAALDSIIKAWHEIGEEVLDGLPYVTKSAWRQSMIDHGMEGKTAAQYVKPSAQGKFAARLIEAKLIEESDQGFKILVPVISEKLVTR